MPSLVDDAEVNGDLVSSESMLYPLATPDAPEEVLESTANILWQNGLLG